LALGDAEADIGMLRLAGVGVAVGNAHPEVKAAADWVAPSAGDGGLAAAVRRFVLDAYPRTNPTPALRYRPARDTFHYHQCLVDSHTRVAKTLPAGLCEG
jgi:hypothetical protein